MVTNLSEAIEPSFAHPMPPKSKLISKIFFFFWILRYAPLLAQWDGGAPQWSETPKNARKSKKIKVL